MCFSATVSFATGAALVALGAVTERRAPPAARAFAAIPLLFGIQQGLEGLVWWSLADPPRLAGAAPALLYSLFSHVLWPVFVPFAIRRMEVVPWRCRALLVTQACGLLVALFFLAAFVDSPPTARVLGSHIAYDAVYPRVAIGMGLYLLATCASSLLSSHPVVRLFGMLSLASFGLTYLISLETLVSVWCFFAALLSVVVAVQVRASLRAWRVAAPG